MNNKSGRLRNRNATTIMSLEVIERIYQIAKENPNGFTLNLETFTFIQSGWIVAMKETQNSFGIEGLHKAYEVAINTSKTLGGWKDGKRFYFDAVIVVKNEYEATRSGIENEQLAIYHLDSGRLKWLK